MEALKIRNERGGNMAAKTGMFVEHAAAMLDTLDHNREQRSIDAARFGDGHDTAFLEWRSDRWERENPRPKSTEPENDAYIEWLGREAIARRRLFAPVMQELIDANGGDDVDHGTLIKDTDE